MINAVGGENFKYYQANDRNIKDMFERIKIDIKQKYQLGYVSSN